jgi:uncharacterized protein (TIGR02646 family)
VRYVRRLPLGHDHDFTVWKSESVKGASTFRELADNWRQSQPPVGNEGSNQPAVRNPRTALVTSLLESQGFLCAWTGQRVSLETSHIDHVVPQSVDSARDLELDNLVAAFPKEGADAVYGAHVRGDSWQPDMVRPNERDCEHRLRYTPTGKVQARDPQDSGAAFTVTEFKLDLAVLNEARAAAIQGFKKRSTFASDLSLLNARMGSNKPGVLPPFASAIANALTAFK